MCNTLVTEVGSFQEKSFNCQNLDITLRLSLKNCKQSASELFDTLANKCTQGRRFKGWGGDKKYPPRQKIW